MIACQRKKFDIPKEVTYLNTAFTAPLMKSVQKAGNKALLSKVRPWTITADTFFRNLEDNRRLFSKLIRCTPDDVAVIPAVSYGIALAAKNIPVKKGQKILILEEQFPSNVFSWRKKAAASDADLTTIRRPNDSDWTTAVLKALDSKTAIVAIPNCHWTDGTLIDLVAVGRRCREFGAALVVDGTQSLGAMPFSVKDVQPDFLLTTSHKWLLGPYSFGFAYVAPKWQKGAPLEENWLNRHGSEDFAKLVVYRDDYQPGARRYDVGEASNFGLAPMAAAALTQILDWKVENIAQTLRGKTDGIATLAGEIGMSVASKTFRSPHLIGVKFSDALPDNLSARLATQNVFVSVRGDSIRISPHLYNTDADIERLFALIRQWI
jgi:selenocysteine lyase/cysteine desulfurase